MRHKDDQKTDLFFTSTLALVSQVGLVGLTIPLIAKRSGVATGTLYIYFKNKEDLILALYKDIKKRFASTIFIGYSPGMSVEEGLRTIWENTVRYSVSHYSEEVFLQQFNISPYSKGPEVLTFAGDQMQPLQELIARGQQLSLLKPDKHLIRQLFIGFIQQIGSDIHQSRGQLTKTWLDTSFRFFWDAIKAT